MKDFAVTYKTAAFVALMIFVMGFAAGFMVSRNYSPAIEVPIVTIRTDTLTRIDTVAGVPLPPKTTVITRVDTLRLQINPANDGSFKTDTTTRKSTPDTSTVPRLTPDGKLLVPISRKVYQTDDYKAVISGWRPNLDTIEVYKKTDIINRTETRTVVQKKRPWLALTVNGGLAYAGKDAPIQAFNIGIRPTVGVGLGFVLKSW